MRALCAVRGVDMLLNAAAGSILRAVHVMQSRVIVNSLFSAMVSFYEEFNGVENGMMVCASFLCASIRGRRSDTP